MSQNIKLSEFVKKALMTESRDFVAIGARLAVPKNIRLLHCTMGLNTELTELIESLYKPNFDLVNVKEEVADAFWYTAIACDELGRDFEKLLNDAYEYNVLHKYENNMIFEFLFKYSTRLVSVHNLILKYRLQKLINKTLIGSGNCLDVMKKTIFYQNREFNAEKFDQNLVITVANLLLMLSQVVDASLEDTLTMLIQKLQEVRYKKGIFTAEESANRDLMAERKILENK